MRFKGSMLYEGLYEALYEGQTVGSIPACSTLFVRLIFAWVIVSIKRPIDLSDPCLG
jgi:hypothetical protein